MTTPYNPSSNGEVERLNRTVIDCLSCYAEASPGTWHEHLDSVLFAYRSSVHAATRFTPFYLQFGREAREPIDILQTSLVKHVYEDITRYKTAFTNELREAYNIVRDRLAQQANRMKKQWDKNHYRKVPKFQIGDQVMMFQPNINKDWSIRPQSEIPEKLERTFHGPRTSLRRRL